MGGFVLGYGDEPETPRGFYGAQVCLDGHVVTGWLGSKYEHREDFCSDCGKSTITDCQKCQTAIRGREAEFSSGYEAPAFCFKCGAAFPWTEASLAAIRELIDLEDEINVADREALKVAVIEVSVDGVRTAVGAARLRKFWGRLGSGLQQVVVGVATEAAKKLILK